MAGMITCNAGPISSVRTLYSFSGTVDRRDSCIPYVTRLNIDVEIATGRFEIEFRKKVARVRRYEGRGMS